MEACDLVEDPAVYGVLCTVAKLFCKQLQLLSLLLSQLFEVQASKEVASVLLVLVVQTRQELHVVVDSDGTLKAVNLVASEATDEQLLVFAEEELGEEVGEPGDLNYVADVKFFLELDNSFLVALHFFELGLVPALVFAAAAECLEEGRQE